VLNAYSLFIYNPIPYVERNDTDENDIKNRHNEVSISLTQMKNEIDKKCSLNRPFLMASAWYDRHNLTRPRVFVLCTRVERSIIFPIREDYTHYRAWSCSCSRTNLLISVATPGSRYSGAQRYGSSRLSLPLWIGFEITFAACRDFEEKWFLLCGVN